MSRKMARETGQSQDIGGGNGDNALLETLVNGYGNGEQAPCCAPPGISSVNLKPMNYYSLLTLLNIVQEKSSI